MSVRRIKGGSTDVSVVLRIVDSTDGTPETGVVFNSAGIDLWYRRELAASTDITEVTLAALTTAHSDGGFLHINDGWYRLDLPDAAVAAGVAGVQIGGTVTGMVVLAPYIEIVAYDPSDAVRLGLTALPNAAAEAAGGLYTRGTGAGQVNQPANGLVDVNVENWNTTAVPAEHTAGYPIVTVKDGAGTGEINTSNGTVTAFLGNGVHGGVGSTLDLQTLTVSNPNGTAVTIDSTGFNGHGILVTGNGTGEGVKLTGGATGNALELVGGGTSGSGLVVTTTSGDGVSITATGTSKHGIIITGGNGGTSDGLKLVAGTGGVGFRIDTLTTGAISCSTITASGAVTFQSTFAVTTSTALGAISGSTLTLSGAVAFQSTFIVTGATTLTGALTATNASNNLTLGTFTVTTNAIAWPAAWDAEVQSEVEDAIVVHRLDELLNADSDIDGAAPPTVGSVFHELMSKTAGSFTFDQTTDSNEALRDRGDAAWITATGFATPTNITAGTITTVTNLTNAPTSGDLTATMKASVNTEVLDVLNVDTFAQPGQEAPAATTTLQKMIAYIYKAFRNKKTQTSTEFKLYADDATTVDQKATVSDDATTFTSGEIGTGP